jgi:glutathione S-transferase
MPRPLRLIDLAFSGWSEKARWALDWKGIPFERVEYMPVIGDLRLWRRTGQAEVPVLLTETGAAIPDSTRIALHLEDTVPEPRLLPARPAERAEALRWQDWAGDTLSTTARAIIGASLAADPAAQLELLPPGAPWLLRAAGRIVAPAGVRVFRWQYDLTRHAVASARARVPGLLETLEQSLARGKRFLVGDSFSLADLAVASALLLLEPPADEYLPRPMPPALRRAYTYAPARLDYGGVFAWRDEMYRRFRKRAAAPEPAPAAAAPA